MKKLFTLEETVQITIILIFTAIGFKVYKKMKT